VSREDDQAWLELCLAETAYLEARMAFFRTVADKAAVLRRALSRADQRGTALRVLALLDEGETRDLLPEILSIASHVNPDLSAARQVIQQMDPEFLRVHLPPLIDHLLEDGGDEEYQRFAELLQQLGDIPSLKALLSRAKASTDPAIREIADDYARLD
jgi:hypothetical protein